MLHGIKTIWPENYLQCKERTEESVQGPINNMEIVPDKLKPYCAV